MVGTWKLLVEEITVGIILCSLCSFVQEDETIELISANKCFKVFLQG